jgi:chromosome segregation ATPase
MSLEETLAALSNSLPDLPARLQELVTEEKGVDKVAVDLINNVARRRGEAADMLANVQHALAGIKGHADQDEAQIKAGGDAIDHAADQVASDVDTQGGTIETHARSADTAMDELERALIEAGREAQDGEHDLQQGVDHLGKALADGQKDVADAADAVVTEMKALDTAFDEAKSAVTDAAHELETALQRTVEETHRRLQHSLDAFKGLCEEIIEALPRQESHLKEMYNTVENTVRTALETDLKDKAMSSASHLEKALGESLNVLDQAEGESRTHRETIEQRVAELREAQQPLPAAVAKLKEACHTAGLSWN